MGGRRWKKWETEFLSENQNSSRQDLASTLNRTTRAIQAKMGKLGLLKPPDFWSDADLQYLQESYHKIPTVQIARCLGRTTDAIKREACLLKITKPNPRWKPEELFLLRDFSEKTLDDLAQELHRSKEGTRRKARRVGISHQFVNCPPVGLSEVQKAYTAGLFDGEGCISPKVSFRGPRPLIQICLQISQKDPTVLYEIRNWVGFGGVYESPKSIARYGVTSLKAAKLAESILPYAIVKRQQLEKLIEYMKLRLSHKPNMLFRREAELILEIYRLNNRKKNAQRDGLNKYLKEAFPPGVDVMHTPVHRERNQPR